MSNLRQLKVNFDSLDDLISGIGPGLSRTHLRIPISAVPESEIEDGIDAGTRVRLELGTDQTGVLIRGTAKVLDSAEEAEPGLDFHLIHLDPSSMRIVDSIVRNDLKDGNVRPPDGTGPFYLGPILAATADMGGGTESQEAEPASEGTPEEESAPEAAPPEAEEAPVEDAPLAAAETEEAAPAPEGTLEEETVPEAAPPEAEEAPVEDAHLATQASLFEDAPLEVQTTLFEEVALDEEEELFEDASSEAEEALSEETALEEENLAAEDVPSDEMEGALTASTEAPLEDRPIEEAMPEEEESVDDSPAEGPWLEESAEGEVRVANTVAGESLAWEAEPESQRHFPWLLAFVAATGIVVLLFKLMTGGEDARTTSPDRAAGIESLSASATPAPADLVAAPSSAGTDGETAPVEGDLRTSGGEPPIAEGNSTESQPSVESEDPFVSAQQAEAAVIAWAKAWSQQDPEAYLESYGADYSPSGLSRDAWESQRRVRITAPERLEVSVRELELEVVEAGRISARFLQLYSTEDKVLAARKTLELERTAAGWKIMGERVER